MIRAAIVAAWLVGAVSSVHSNDLSNLVDRYAVWRGGMAFEQMTSVRFTAALDTAGLHGTENLWADRDGHLRVDTDLGVLKQTQVVAPDGAWDTSPSGQIESLSLADRHNLMREIALQFPDVLRGRAGATATLEAPQVRGDRTWAVVRVRFGDEDIYDVFIDSKTGELGGFHITEDRKSRSEQFNDWRMVDGVRMPFLQTVSADDGSDAQTIKVEALALNTPIPSERLSRPARVRKATFADGTTTTGGIDFEFYNDNRIFFPARINGHDTVVLLDSGATVSAVDKAFAAAIGLTSKGDFNAPGAGGLDTTGFVGGVEIEIGAMTLHGVNAATFDFTPIAQRIGHPMPFVLGAEVFNEFAVDIDFVNRRLAFSDPDTLRRPVGAAEVPLVRIKDRSVPVSVEGAPPVPFEFDLGDGSPLDIYPAFYEAHDLLRGRRTSEVEAGGVGGFQAETVASIRRISLAGVEFHDVPTNFTPDVASANNSNLLFGTVGLPILARFHLVVDYTHDRLFATPNPATINASFAKDRLGATLVKQDGIVMVRFISPGGPAETAGLRTGERILSINGKAAAEWTDAAIASLRFEPAGSMIKLTFSDGRMRTVKRRNFF